MGTKEKAANTTQDVKGKVKESVGKATGNKKLEREGKTDQVKSAIKDVGEDLKTAASKVKKAVTK